MDTWIVGRQPVGFFEDEEKVDIGIEAPPKKGVELTSFAQQDLLLQGARLRRPGRQRRFAGHGGLCVVDEAGDIGTGGREVLEWDQGHALGRMIYPLLDDIESLCFGALDGASCHTDRATSQCADMNS